MANEEAGQLKIQQQINAALQERQKLMEANSAQIKGQTQLAMELCKAMKCEDLEGMADRINDITGAMQSAASEAEKLSQNTADIAGGADKTKKSFMGLDKQQAKNAAGAAAMGAAVINGLNAGKEAALGLIKTMGSVGSSIMGVGKAILMAPFNMLSGLVGMAQSGGGGGNEIAQAYQDVKKVWGDLNSNEGKQLLDGMKSLRGEAKNLGGTGISLGKIYGRGPGGVAAAMKDLAGIAEEAGAAFGLVGQQLQKDAGKWLAYKKGMGLTDDAMAAIIKKSTVMGTDVTDELHEVANMSLQMGKKFGISAKLISKDMGKMMKDFSNFGSMSKAEMATASVYARKLGMEIEDMMGVIDKWDNFEDAAQGASQLAQSFGMNVDAMEMMNAQNPAERIDILRKSFSEAGKSVQDMSRQERKLLEQQTGLTGAALDAAFANENMGLSYEDIQAGAEEAEAEQMSQEQAMSDLAKAIEKITESGGGKGFTGFFDAFAKGFKDGITKSKVFMQLFKNLNKSLKATYFFGKNLGKMFVEMFPGIKDMAEALRDIFDPKKFKLLFDGLMKDFKKFFQALKTDPKAGVETLIKDLSKRFKDFFGGKGELLKKFKEGFTKAVNAVGGILSGLIPIVIQKLSDMIKGMADFIRNPKKLTDAATDGMGGAILGALKNVGQALIDNAPILLNAFLDLLSAVWEKHSGTIIKVGGVMVAFVVGKMLMAGFMSALSGAATMALSAFIAEKLFGVVQVGAKGAVKKSSGMGGELQKAGGKKGIGGGLKGFIDSFDGITFKDILEFGAKLALMSLMMIPPLLIFAAGLVGTAMILSKVPFADLIKAFLTLYVMSKAMGQMIMAFMFIKPQAVIQAGLGALAAAAFVAVGLMVFAAALWLIQPLLAQINFMSTAKGFILMAIAVYALTSMLPSVMAMSAMATPQAMGIALLGFLAAAALTVIGIAAFSLALMAVGPLMAMIPFGSIAGSFLGLAGIMVSVALAALAAAAAGVFALVAIAAMPYLAAFCVAMIPFVIALGLLGKGFSMVNWKPVTTGWMGLAISTGAMALTMAAMAVAGYLAIPAAVGAILSLVFIEAMLLPTLALGAFGAISAMVPWKPVAYGWTMLAVATAGMLLAMAAMALASYLAVPAIIGANMSLGFIWAMVPAALSLVAFSAVAQMVNWGYVATVWTEMAFGMLPMVATMALMALAIYPAVLGGIGALLSIVFIGAIALLALALVEFEKHASKVTWSTVAKVWTDLAMMMLPMVATMYLAIVGGVLSIPATVGMLLVSLYVRVTTELLGAFKDFGKAAKDVSWANVALGWVSLGLSMVPLLLTMLTAIAGLVLALPATVGMWLTSLFIWSVVKVLDAFKDFGKKSTKVDWKQVSMAFGSLGTTMVPVLTSMLAATAAAMLGLSATFGMLLVIPFIWATVKALDSMEAFAKGSTKVPWKKIGKTFMDLSGAMLPLLLSMFLAVPLAILGIPASLGMLGATLFVMALGKYFVPALAGVAPAISGLPMKKLAQNFVLLAVVMTASVVMAAEAVLMGIAFAIPGMTWLAKKGFKVIGVFADSLVEHLGPAMVKIDAMPIPDPKGMATKLKIIKDVMDTTTGMSDIVVKVAELDAMAAEAGGKSGDLLKGAAEFADELMSGVGELIKVVIFAVKSIKTKDAKKAEMFGNIMGAVAKLMGALAPPPSLFKVIEGLSGWFSGPSPAEIRQILMIGADYASAMMDAIKSKLGPMIETILGVKIPRGDPKQTKAKGEMVSQVITAVAEFMGSLGGMSGISMPKDANVAEIAASAAMQMSMQQEHIKKLIDIIVEVMPPFLKALLKLKVKGNPAMIEAKSKIIGTVLKGVAAFMKMMGDIVPESKVLKHTINTPGGIISKGSKQVKESLSDPMEEMKGQLKAIEALFSAMQGFFPPFLKAILGIKLPESKPEMIKAKGELIGTVLASVAEFMKAMDALTPKVQESEHASEGFGNNVKTVSKLPVSLADQRAHLTGMLSMMSAHIPPLLQAILKVNLGPKVKPKTVALKAEAIGNLLGAVGTFMTAMKDMAPGGTKEVMTGEMTEATYFEKSRPIMKTVSTFPDQLDQMKQMITTLTAVLPPFIQSILNIDFKGVDPKVMKARIDVMAAAIGVVGNFTQALKNIQDAVPDTTPSMKPASVEDQVRWVKKMVEGIKEPMKGLVLAVMEVGALITKPRTVGRQLKLLCQMISFVGDFTTVLQGMNPGSLSSDEILTPLSNSAKVIRTLLTQSATSGSKYGMQDIVYGLDKFYKDTKGFKNWKSGIYVAGKVAKGLNTLSKAFDQMGEIDGEVVSDAAKGVRDSLVPFGNLVEDIAGIYDKGKTLGKMRTIRLKIPFKVKELVALEDKSDTMAQAIETVNDNMASSYMALDTMVYGAQDINDAAADLLDVISEQGALEQLPKVMPTMMNDLVSIHGVQVNALANMGETAKRLDDLNMAGMVLARDNVVEMVEAMQDIHEALYGMEGISLQGILTQFGEAMKISEETITIENKPININVSFNVTMNANKIAAALSDTTITTQNTLVTAGGGAGGG